MHRSIALAAALCLAGGIVSAQQGIPGANFITQWDLDGDGTVSVAEATERRGDIFTMFDADENDMLSDEEYTLFDETRAADMANNAQAEGMMLGGHGPMNAGLERMANDTNGDGVVTRAEFVAMAGAWIGMMDRNGDGGVTVDDFGRK